FFFVINWRMFPLQLAVTYSVDLNGALFTSDEVGAPYAVAFRRYIQLKDADRNSKLKVIPRVVEGPWLVKKSLTWPLLALNRRLFHVIRFVWVKSSRTMVAIVPMKMAAFGVNLAHKSIIGQLVGH
ncbi:WD repeat-containing protein 12, partial [Perkinsus olseni]